MTLNSPISDVKGVGEKLAEKLHQLKINKIIDVIEYLPRKYNDYSFVQSIISIKPGQVTIKAKIKQATGRYVRRGMHITEAVASDSTGSVRLVWFNQPYRTASIKTNEEYYISGNFQLSYRRLSIGNPSVELVSDFPLNTARIIPVYREVKGVKSAQIRRILKEIMPLIRSLPESLPQWLIEKESLISRTIALETLHFPQTNKNLEAAKKRLGFEEVFQFCLASLLNKLELGGEKSLQINFNKKLAVGFVKKLPFTLTDTQRKAVWQIYLDMQKDCPMNRMLEGDVGSGKTVVAAMAALMVVRQGYQVAFMAPTEILARQHAETITKLFDPLGMAEHAGLLVGSLNTAQKNIAYKHIKSGDIKMLIGTQALIQEKVDFHKLGLVIVDEQHRFGVDQRAVLQKKAGHMPHVLTMSATPIPRSLALTLYGELDISVMDSKPSGRQLIKTTIISPNSRAQLNKLIELQLQKRRQVFTVCPAISDAITPLTRTVEDVYNDYKAKSFKNWRIGLLHGKMTSKEKEKVMQDFALHKIDILVTTTVIEVGVDVPNATVMVIENADRFGLAQIHQLRGRVGRSTNAGFCYLVMSDSSSPSPRLRALENSNDGFKLAELDLEIRGPGAIYGQLQHGALDLRIAKLTDTKLIASARIAAQDFINRGDDLLQYKELSSRVQELRAITNLN